MRQHKFLFLILFLYLILGTLFAVYTPDWQAPDEPAHYNYIKQLANGRFPIMQKGDYDQEYLPEAIRHNFAPPYSIEPITYEDWQPPLYYLLQTPVFIATNGSLLALRLVSVLLGAGVVAFAYAIALQIAPTKRWLAGATAVTIAFIPQHLAILASVNNDALAELLIAAILWMLVRRGGTAGGATGNAERPFPPAVSPRLDWQLGVLLGLGYLTKGTVYPLTAVIGLTLLHQYWGNWKQLWKASLQTGLPALLLGSLWWIRNIIVYGGLDILGKAAHDAVVIGQPRTAEWIAVKGLDYTLNHFTTTTFNSFWGQFGWMALPMNNPGWLYPLLQLFSAVALLGFILTIIPNLQSPISNLPQSLILATTLLLSFAVHIGYNITFVQAQGRYLFSALIPISLGIAIGLGFWLRPLRTHNPQTSHLLPAGLAILFITLDLYALFGIIIPAF